VNRLRTTAALTTILVVLAACGPAASSDSAEPSSEASVAASEAQPSEGGNLPSFSAGVVADLEALIPDTVGGVTVQKVSMAGSEFLISPDSDDALVEFVEDIGVGPTDISMASGSALTSEGVFLMFVIRAAGADSTTLVSAFKEAQSASMATPLQWSSATIGGKQVDEADLGGQSTYIYAMGDVLVWVVASDTAAAEEVLGGLP